VAVLICGLLATAPLAVAQKGVAARPTFALFLDVGDPTGAPAREPAGVAIRAFASRVQKLMGVPSSRTAVRTGSPLTRDDIRSSIRGAASAVEPGGMLLMYLRAYVTKPDSARAIFVYPGDGDIAFPPPADKRPIRDTELIEWLTRAPSDAQVALFLDLRTTDQSLLVYFASRPAIGDASVTTIASTDPGEPMAAAMARLLGADADTDANATLDIHELGRAYREELYGTGVTTEHVIAGLTGDALPLVELPSAVMIGGPPGSRAIVDDVDVGETPVRYTPGTVGRYEVSVAAPGYLRPETRVVEITRKMGEAQRASFLLEKLRVHGVISAPAGAPVGPLVVGVMPGAGLVARPGGPGEYEVPAGAVDWDVGSEYRLLAGSPDERYFGGASFVYDGYQDIAVDIALEERTLWQVAAIYDSKGLTDEATRAAAAASDARLEVPADLSPEFGAALLGAWSDQTASARIMIACARITELTHGPKEARAYWRLARKASKRGTPERDIATAGLRASAGGLHLYAILGLLALAASAGVFGLRYRRRHAG